VEGRFKRDYWCKALRQTLDGNPVIVVIVTCAKWVIQASD
jgi:hypothetical protein